MAKTMKSGVAPMRWVSEPKRDRVVYEYWAAPLSEEDKAGLIRYLLEGKFYK